MISDKMKLWERSHLVIVAITILGLSTCSIFIFGFQYRLPLDADSLEYDSIAWNFAQGRGLFYNGAPYVTKPPSYIIFVGLLYTLFGHMPAVVLLAQAILYACACVLLYLIARKVCSDAVAALAGLMMATYFPLAYYASGILTETFVIFFMTLTIFTLIRYAETRELKYVTMCGVCLGIGILCKPILIFFPGFIAAYLAFTRVRMKELLYGTATLSVITAALLSLWVTRNYVVFGEFILLSKNNLGPLILRPILDEDHKYLLWNDVHTWTMRGSDDPRKVRDDEIARRLDREMRATPQRSKDILYAQEALKLIYQDPLTYVAGCLVRVARLWISYPTRSGTYLKIVVGIFDLTIISLAIIGFAVFRRRWRALSILWLPLLYITLVQVPLHVEARYSAPMKPYLLILTAIGVSQFIGATSRHVLRSAHSLDKRSLEIQ
jgi:4-amino-4-deoxy-L-arabinose transferase-like glycosyltransferase